MTKLETRRAKRARWLPAQGARCIKSLQRSFVQIQRSRASLKARPGGRQVMGYDGRWWPPCGTWVLQASSSTAWLQREPCRKAETRKWGNGLGDGGMKGKEMSWERWGGIKASTVFFPKQMGCLKKIIFISLIFVFVVSFLGSVAWCL